MAEEDRSLVSRRADRRAAQREAQANQPEFTSDPIFKRENLQDAATFAASVTPVVGDAMAVQEIYDELQKEDPNYFLIGALGGAAMVGLVPIVGDAAAGAIRAGARSAASTLGRTAERLNDAAARADRRIMTGTIGDLYRSATNRRIGRRASRNAPAMPNDEAARSLGFNDYVYHGTPSDSGDFANIATIDELGLDSFEPHDFLGFHVGTPSAANQRISAEDVFGPNSNLPTGSGSDGIVKELRARTDQPFTNNGRLWSEEELRDFLTERLDDLNKDSPTPISVPQGMAIIRRELADQGYTHVPYMNNVEDAYSESYIMLIDRAADSPAVLRDSRAAFDPERITERNLSFNKGGVAMKEQMEFLFEEGGIADDGMDRDPVSGNEVPAGSLAKEVRDDIPAQLSEGEYVVPADVVRYYGVKFFEDLREDAKEGLGDMEEEGRIGGEPVVMEDDDMDLSDEEKAELDAIMGMAVGGYVTGQPTQATDPYAKQADLYRAPAPVAVGNTGMADQMALAFNEGGTVPPTTQVVPNFEQQYQAGYTFMGDPRLEMTTQPVDSMVTIYSPQGVPLQLMLPSQKTLYDQYIAQGYTTTAPTPQVQPVVQQPQQSDDNGPEMTQQEYESRLDRAFTGSDTFSRSELNTLNEDPLGFIESELGTARSQEGMQLGASAVAGLIGGPLIGGAAMAASTLNPIARSRAALEIARSRGTYSAEQLTAAETAINNRINELPLVSRMALGMGAASGKRYAEDARGAMGRISDIANFDSSANRPSYLGNRTGVQILDTVMGAASKLSGPAAQSYAESAERGYTGTGPRGIAVGNISGVGGVNGVVVDPETGKALRTEDNKTIFRDTEGRTYVRTGLLGRGIEYRDIPNVPSSGTPPPENTQGVDTGNSDNEKGEGSVICTALFKKGLLSKEIYALDTQYGLMLDLNRPEVTRGYRKLASPLANYIQKDTLGAKAVRSLVAPLAKAWANEMAHQMQPEKYEGNVVGKAIMALGYPVCAFVGKRTKEIIYGT